jgi:hypothetical protein
MRAAAFCMGGLWRWTPARSALIKLAGRWKRLESTGATTERSFAAAYLGFSVAFGHTMRCWADLLMEGIDSRKCVCRCGCDCLCVRCLCLRCLCGRAHLPFIVRPLHFPWFWSF